MILDSNRRELMYFENLEVMTWVEYRIAGNLLRYAAHRELELKERLVIESYLLQVYAPAKTKYYALPTAAFAYCGVYKNLLPVLKNYLMKRGVDVDQEARAEEAVAEFLKSKNIQVV